MYWVQNGVLHIEVREGGAGIRCPKTEQRFSKTRQRPSS